MISYFMSLSAAKDAKGTNVSLKPSPIIEISIDAASMGRKILLNGIPSDFSAISSLPPFRVDIPSSVDNSDDIGTVRITTSGSLYMNNLATTENATPCSMMSFAA